MVWREFCFVDYYKVHLHSKVIGIFIAPLVFSWLVNNNWSKVSSRRFSLIKIRLPLVVMAGGRFFDVLIFEI